MNTKRHHSPVRSLLLTLGTTLMLTLTGLTGGAAQLDTNLLAVNYIDLILERGDQGVASSLVAPDATLFTPEGVYNGQNGAVAFTLDLGTSFSDLEFDVVDFVSVESALVIQFTMSGVQTGTYQGIPGLCANISVPGVATLAMNGGSIGEQRITYDQAEIIQQAARFNMFATFEGHSCSTLTSPADVPLPPAPPAPTCLKVNQCELPA